MKQFKEFRVFKKAVRKYWKRYAKKSYFYHNGKRMTSWWVADNIWCYYLVDNYEELKQKNIRDWFRYDVDPDMVDEFIENHKDLFGKHIVGNNIFSNKEEVKGEFIGFSLVNNGVLFTIKTNNGINLYGFNIEIKKDENYQ